MGRSSRDADRAKIPLRQLDTTLLALGPTTRAIRKDTNSIPLCVVRPPPMSSTARLGGKRVRAERSRENGGEMNHGSHGTAFEHPRDLPIDPDVARFDLAASIGVEIHREDLMPGSPQPVTDARSDLTTCSRHENAAADRSALHNRCSLSEGDAPPSPGLSHLPSAAASALARASSPSSAIRSSNRPP